MGTLPAGHEALLMCAPAPIPFDRRDSGWPWTFEFSDVSLMSNLAGVASMTRRVPPDFR